MHRLSRGYLSGTNKVTPEWMKPFALCVFIVALSFTPLHAQNVAAYVAQNGAATVSVIDTATNTVTATVPAGRVVNGIGVVASPDGTRVYVTGSLGSGSGVEVIDTATNAVIASVPLPFVSLASFLAITPDGSRLYVPDNLGNTVTVIDTVANAVVGNPITVGTAPNAVAITPDGARAYVTSAVDGTVTVIQTATNTVVDPPISMGAGNPSDLAVTPDGRFVYVSTPTPGSSTVAVIDTSNNSVATQIPLPGTQELPFGLAITRDGSKVYVAVESFALAPILGGGSGNPGASGVVVIDTATNTPTFDIHFGSAPFQVAVTPNGAFSYVTDLSAGAVLVVDAAQNAVVGTPIQLTGNAEGIAIVKLPVPFAAFTVEQLTISHHRFGVQGDFTLGKTSSGIDLARQAVTLTIGSFTLTIPAGKFQQVHHQPRFVFDGTIGGLDVAFDIRAERHHPGSFDFSAKVKGVDLISQPNPITVVLEVGPNFATTSVTVNQEREDPLDKSAERDRPHNSGRFRPVTRR
jgi:YVTN family beta-propeller protein